MEPTGAELKAEIIARRVRQSDVAAKLGIDDSSLSKILSGARSRPENFASEFRAALQAAVDEKVRQLLGTASEEVAA